MNQLVNIVFLFLLFNMGCSGINDSKSDDLVNSENKAFGNMAKRLMPHDYLLWIENTSNGLKVEKVIGDFTYSLQYKPLEYAVLLELRKDSVKQTELMQKSEEYNGLQYYTFRISTDSQTELLKINLNEENDYYGRLQYFSFDMQKDLKLIDGLDTLDCVLFHFERVYGVAPYATFNLGFPKTDDTNNKTLFYDEKVFSAGRIYLTVKAENIKNIPSVITY